MKKKYRHADAGELVMVFGHPFPVMEFVMQDFDKRQYYLQFTNGMRTYFTSINLTKWDSFDFETKAKVAQIAVQELKMV